MRRILLVACVAVLSLGLASACGNDAAPHDTREDVIAAALVRNIEPANGVYSVELDETTSKISGKMYIAQTFGEYGRYGTTSWVWFEQRRDGSWIFGCFDDRGVLVDFQDSPRLVELFNAGRQACPVGFVHTPATPSATPTPTL
jgi:hypothetical protein